MRPPFLDDIPTAEACRRTRAARCCGRTGGCVTSGRARGRTCVISHEMSRRYVLEYPVDDPDPEDDDDVDDEDEDDDDEDDDEDEIETWQVSEMRPFR